MADLSGCVLGEFIVREPIGEGGHAVIYRAEQPALKRDVVVKVLRAGRQRVGAALDRFLREAQLASQLDHPYAVHVYAFGEHDGRLWIAMELVHGVSLAVWLKRHGPMPLDRFIPFFGCLAEVVDAAHQRGIVHRDLKPANVMVVERGGRLLPKLLDLGIAKVADELLVATRGLTRSPSAIADAEGISTEHTGSSEDACRTDTATPVPGRYRLTRTGVHIGTVPYMSPEQWSDAAAVGPASDVYALGILAYETLTGRRPFRGESTSEYYQLHLHAEMPLLGVGFSPVLDRVLGRAVAKDPAARHGSALELAADLRVAWHAQPREQIRSLAQVWDAAARSPELLLKAGDLLSERTEFASELERAFMVASRRHAARRAHVRRAVAASVAVLAVLAIWYRLRTEKAQEIADLTLTLFEREQGRAALLHGEPDAARHLATAYPRDRSPATAFMLARALQPQLAERARFASSSGQMWSATFSPDGRRVLTSDDKNAQIWDAQSQRLEITLAHGDTVYQAVYNSDGTWIVTVCNDGAVRIWDSTTGALVRELRRDGPVVRYYALAISRNGKLVAAIDVAGAVAHVWDVDTGAALAELRNDASAFPSVAFSADDRWLATSGGGDARVFDVRTWSQVASIPGVRCMSWDPAGPRLLTGGVQGDVALWELPGGRRVHHLRDLGEAITAVAYAPDGRLVVAASRDGTEQVWDAHAGALRSQGNYLHGPIRAIEFDASSTLTVAAGYGGSVAVLDAQYGVLATVLDAPRTLIAAAHFDARSRRVIGASWDGTARIWDTTAPYRQWGSPPMASSCGVSTAPEPDRHVIAVACGSLPTRVWDTRRGEMLAELPSVVPAGDDFASALPAVSSAGDRVAIARGAGVEVYDLPSGRLLRAITHGALVNAVAFASSGQDLVTGATDGSLRITHDSGAQLAIPRASAGIDVAGVLPDGRLVAADAQRRLRVYDAHGTMLADLETSARAVALRMSPDGRRVITLPRLIGTTASPELWDIEHMRIVAHLGRPEQGHVWAASFAADDAIVTASGDGAARLWDGTTGMLRQTYPGGSRFLSAVTLSPDGAMVIGGDADGMLRFWDRASGAPLWNMLAHRSPLIGIYTEHDKIVTRGFLGDVSRWLLPKPDHVLAVCRRDPRCATVFP